MNATSQPDPRAIADSLVFRVATAADLSQLALWNQQLIEDERHDNTMSLEELEARMRNWLATEYEALVFEDRTTPRPAAYALFRRTPEWIHLRQFFVARDRRRRGIGARAVALLLAEVFPPGKSVIVEAMAWNHAALSFWRAVGFADRYVGLESRPEEST
nr:GNAT family N-acetyltransferase [Pseudomonadota bacterium]